MEYTLVFGNSHTHARNRAPEKNHQHACMVYVYFAVYIIIDSVEMVNTLYKIENNVSKTDVEKKTIE